MKKLTFLFLTSLILFNCENESVEELQANPPCDNGTFTPSNENGIIFLQTQQEIDDFGAMCYSKINGNLIVGQIGMSEDIIDLTPLNSLTEIFNGIFNIGADNLTNLDGLQNLRKVDGLRFNYCFELNDLSALSNLHTIVDVYNNPFSGGLRISNCPNLTSLEGFNGLTAVDAISIISCTNLVSLNGLENLTTVVGIENVYDISIGLECFHIPCGPLLSQLADFCGLQNFFINNINFNQDEFFISNFTVYKPTIQDIIDGNCSQ